MISGKTLQQSRFPVAIAVFALLLFSNVQRVSAQDHPLHSNDGGHEGRVEWAVVANSSKSSPNCSMRLAFIYVTLS
jgi:hypothetical protein